MRKGNSCRWPVLVFKMKKEPTEVVKETKGNELKGKWESHLV